MGSPPNTAEIQQQQQHQQRCREVNKRRSKKNMGFIKYCRHSTKQSTNYITWTRILQISRQHKRVHGTANRKQQIHQEQKHDVHKLQGSADISASPTLFFEVFSIYQSCIFRGTPSSFRRTLHLGQVCVAIYQSCIFRGTPSSFRRTLHLGQVYVTINWRIYQMSIKSAYITSIIAFMKQLQVHEDP